MFATPIAHGATLYGFVLHASDAPEGEQSEEPSGFCSGPVLLLPALKTTAIPASCSAFVATLTGWFASKRPPPLSPHELLTATTPSSRWVSR